jgi:hypothetical protein
MGGIQEVGATFEWLHREPAPSQRSHDRQRNRRLPDTTRSA